MEDTVAAPRLTPGKGLLVLLCVILGIAAYIGIATALGITTLVGGYLFSLYFGAIKTMDPKEFIPSLAGALGGIVIASLLAILPAHLGNAGFALALLAIVSAVYASIMGWLPMLINNAFLLFLTVATAPQLQADADFTGMAASVLVVAAMMGALVQLGKAMSARRIAASAS